MMMPTQLPQDGDVVRVRQRTWLVSDVTPGSRPKAATRVQLHCLDADAAGDPLAILWEAELDAEVITQVEGAGAAFLGSWVDTWD